MQRRFRKFRGLKRGYWSFLLIAAAYLVSFFLPLLVNDKPLVIDYQGSYYFPEFRYYSGTTFGQDSLGEIGRAHV